MLVVGLIVIRVQIPIADERSFGWRRRGEVNGALDIYRADLRAIVIAMPTNEGNAQCNEK